MRARVLASAALPRCAQALCSVESQHAQRNPANCHTRLNMPLTVRAAGFAACSSICTATTVRRSAARLNMCRRNLCGYARPPPQYTPSQSVTPYARAHSDPIWTGKYSAGAPGLQSVHVDGGTSFDRTPTAAVAYGVTIWDA